MSEEVKIVDGTYTQEKHNSFIFVLLCVSIFISSVLAIIVFYEEGKVQSLKDGQAMLVIRQQKLMDEVSEFERNRKAVNRRDSIAYVQYRSAQIKAFNEWQKAFNEQQQQKRGR